jgi:hypothetical protein
VDHPELPPTNWQDLVDTQQAHIDHLEAEVARLTAWLEQSESGWVFADIWERRQKATRLVADQLAEVARLIAEVELDGWDPTELEDKVWDRVHPTVGQIQDAVAALAAYNAMKETP